MDLAARQYARKILLIHLGVLLGVLLIVAVAAREVYYQTRLQSLRQAERRQELLAWQAGRGIENYYDSIIGTLDLIQRGEGEQANTLARIFGDRLAGRTPLRLASVFWSQLNDRVSHVFGVTPVNNKVTDVFPPDQTAQAQLVAKTAADWLRNVDDVAISPIYQFGNEWAHLVAVPAFGDGPRNRPSPPGAPGSRTQRRPPLQPQVQPSTEERTLLIAVVPADRVQSKFLSSAGKDGLVSARLIDATGLAVASSLDEPPGVNLARDAADPALAKIIRDYVPTARRGSESIDRSATVNARKVPPRLVSVEPVEILGQRWALVIASPLSEVDALVNSVFRRALFWTLFLVIAVTATLLSTATHMIRGRLRLERMQSDMLNRELSQARQIQLAWLPDAKVNKLPSVDLAAVNKPASHISGDFYDWFELPDGKTVVTIGDVTGHGMGAAFLMATTQLLIRTTMPRVKDPGRCLDEVNRQLCSQVFNGQFVTALILVIDREERTLDLATAGHFAPLLSDGASPMLPLDVSGELVLGIDPTSAYSTERFDLPDHYALLLYTDGVLDARAANGDRFKLDRLLETVSEPSPTAQAIVQSIVEHVVEFQGTAAMSDDLTLVAIHAPPTSRSSPTPAREAVAV